MAIIQHCTTKDQMNEHNNNVCLMQLLLTLNEFHIFCCVFVIGFGYFLDWLYVKISILMLLERTSSNNENLIVQTNNEISSGPMKTVNHYKNM